jgi:hypothetical protein
MCTLTFVPAGEGYLAAMNRDELLTRPTALRPQTHGRYWMKYACPREPSGGTWIACNGLGNLLALLNWNEVDTAAPGEKRRTRGAVIPELILEENLSSTGTRLERLNLEGIFPFRLIGVFLNEKQLIEWRWDGSRIQRLESAWVRKHWFSSGLSDTTATEQRSRVCQAASLDPAVGTTNWLRSLHRSHEPKPGPYSVCVHRPDAATVSYTEVECRLSLISMSYLSGNPCLKKDFETVANLSLSSQSGSAFENA